LLDVAPTFVERVGASESLDADHRIRSVDHKLISVAGSVVTHLAADDTFSPVEKTDHG